MINYNYSYDNRGISIKEPVSDDLLAAVVISSDGSVYIETFRPIPVEGMKEVLATAVKAERTSKKLAEAEKIALNKICEAAMTREKDRPQDG